MSGRLNNPKFLVGEWKLNNNAKDSSGHGNDGTPTALTYTDGQYGKTVGVFNGSTTGVSITSKTLSSEYSISFWANLSDGTNSNMVIGIASDANNYIYLRNGTRLRFTTNGTLLNFTNNTDFLDRDRHYVIVVADAKATLYIDSMFAEEVGVASSFSYDNIGSPYAGSNLDFNGQIWDVKTYNIPLTNDEVKAL